MDEKELIELIRRGEDSRTQFKRSQNVANARSLAGEMAALANSRGGRIIIGVDDNGSISGLSSDDIRRINQLISNTATDCVRPSINPETDNFLVDGKLVMVLTVPEGVSKPYADNEGVYWVKSGADKRRVTAREELQRMLAVADLIHADEIPVAGSTEKDIDLIHFDRFFEKQYGAPLEETLLREKISIGQLLNNLGLARDKTPNLAGILLFSRNPQRHRPALVIKAVSFIGDDPAYDHYRDSEDINGCLLDLHKGAMSFLTRNLQRLQGEKDFNTLGDLEIAPAALEELVVNMLLHRDYFITAPWRIMIFDHRIELISPGALPNNLTVTNIRHGVSIIRNPLLASFATKELPYRGLGTGIRRALAFIPDLELQSDHERNLFTAIIPRPVRQSAQPE